MILRFKISIKIKGSEPELAISFFSPKYWKYHQPSFFKANGFLFDFYVISIVFYNGR